MKKLLLLVSLLVAGMSLAGARTPKSQKIESAQRILQNVKAAPSRSNDNSQIIFNPEGEYKYFTRDIKGFDSEQFFEESGDAALVVFGQNDEVYFQDLIPFHFFRSFVKGTLSNGVINVPLPQRVSNDYMGVGYPVDICILQRANKEFTVTNEDHVEFIYDETSGSISLNLPSSQYVLGLVFAAAAPTPIGDGNYYDVFTPYNDVTEIPADVEISQYMFREGDAGYPLYMGTKDDKIFIKGLSQDFPQGVIEATVEGNKAMVAQDQIVGAAYGCWVKTKCLVPYDNDWDYAPQDAVYEMDYNKSANLLIGYDTDYMLGLIGIYGEGPAGQLQYWDLYDDFQIFIQSSYAGTPQNPYDLVVNTDNVDEGGAILFLFQIPVVSTDNSVLDYKSLYYRIYVDGEIMEFEMQNGGEIYNGIEGTVTELPFEFTNDSDIWAYTYTIRIIQIYQEGVSSLGVQSVYRYDGITTLSDIVTYDIATGEIITTPAGVSAIGSEETVGIQYYDLTGRKITSPSKGIYIERKQMTDGSFRSGKIIL